ncbi:MAG: lactococcin 972 family bacteriocin [Micromonosporaceae bacterium]
MWWRYNTRYHSSTASMASQTRTDYASAGYWSEASVTAGWAYTCYTYWNDTP